ncbi:MAG: hypothetical protein KA004_10810 [Verrucomicrobiales bacterium]|nr:hypothetical protein [Verrucomicrobiales bacterium]
MATEAKIRSIDVLVAFRSTLIVFHTRARQAVDQVTDTVRRAQQWVQGDQAAFWEGQVKRRTRAFEQAQAELMTARLSALIDTPSAQQAAFRKAKYALDEATEKLKAVRRWSRNFETVFDPLTKRLDGLNHFLVHDIPKGIALLGQMIKILDAYAETTPLPSGVVPKVSDSPEPGTPPPSAER